MTFPKTLIALLALVASATATRAQEPGAGVAAFLAAAAELRHEAAADRLLVLRREHPGLVRPLLVLRRQAQAAATGTAIAAAELEARALRLAAAGEEALAAPARALRELDGLRGGAPRPAENEVMDALERALAARIADAAIRRHEDRGSYAGMFAELFGGRPRIARGFMDLFLDRLGGIGHRGYAAQGAAELAVGAQRAEFAAEAALVLAQEDENPAIHRAALVLMKRCGRDAEFDAAVAGAEARLGAERAKERGKRSVTIQLEALETLVDLLARAGLDAAALGHDEALCRLLLAECSYETQSPEARAQIATTLYDFSCRLSRAGTLAAAELVLELALGWGYRNLDWLESDPELAGLRAQKGVPERIAAWRKGDLKAGRPGFEPERWDRVVGGGVTDAVARMRAAEAAK